MAGGAMSIDDLEVAAAPEDRALTFKKTIDGLIDEMSKIEVDSDEKYQALEAWVKKNKDTQKVITDFYEPERVQAKARYDEVLAAKSKLLKPLEVAEQTTRKRMQDWSTKREAERRAEQARIEAEQRAAAEDDTLEQAETLSAMGRQDKADELLEKGPKVSRVAVAAAMTTTKVGRTMEKWEVTVTDLDAFLTAIPGMGLIEECIDVSTTKLAALFKKNGTREFPGLKVEQKFVPVI